MKSVINLNEAVKALDHNQNLCLILQDWDSGIQLELNQSTEQVLQRLNFAREKYGDRFAFRAFNKKVDVYWNGDFGIICTDEEGGESQNLLLEFDTKRHPGMINFERALIAGSSKSLRDFKIEAQIINNTDGGPFLRFVKISEVNENAEF
jgi:hypothetical protein